jgi:2-hydroxychromene-2-carboxylate isomerase
MPELTFYFDLGSPYAYLASERVEELAGGPVAWQPVLLGGLFKLTGRSSWALEDYRRRQRGMAEIERRVRDYGLPAMRWPDPWPSNYLLAMRACVVAFAAGRGREFIRAAYRGAFQRGEELGIPAHVWKAARAAGLEPDAVQAAVAAPETKRALRDATEAAHARGVFGVPTLAVGQELFWGDDRLEAAITELSRVSPVE